MKTIKHLFTTILMFASLTWAGAQANYGEFRWGLTAGINFANVNNLGDFKKEKGKAGFVGGAFCKIPLSTSLSIRPELLYSMKGATFRTFDSNGQEADGQYNLNYLEIPVSLDFELFGMLDFHAGLQADFLLGESYTVNDKDEALDENFYNKVEYGFHLGSGIDFGNIGLHVRFQQSLSSFVNNVDAFEPRNWGITFTAAYMFL